MEELTKSIMNKATEYWNETGEEKIEAIPSSIVDFVIECAIAHCHFPKTFNEKQIIEVLDSKRNILAMACIDVYAKAGIEGEKSHSENGISRVYSDSWISSGLFDRLPNYVNFIS